MSFFDLLRKIQKKPETTRKKILIITVSALMALIVFLWLISLRHTIEFAKPEELKAPGPFSVLKDTILKGFENLKEIY